MTATDELRRLLDERGVEWFESVTREGLTWIYRDGKAIRFHPWQPDTLKVSMFDLTPAQAIAATLGSGTCHYEIAFFGDGKAWFACSECGGMASADYDPPKYCPHCGRRVVDE